MQDCWVSIFGKVYELTAFLAANKGPLIAPIVEFAGQDISHWFDERTGDVKTKFDEDTGLVLPHLPHGRFCHVPPPEPVTDWRTDFGTAWWRNQEFCIGELSQETRFVRIVNTLTRQEDMLEVCSEESMQQILDRYLDFNGHASSYTWKMLDEADFRPMDMQKTLAENGVTNEASEFERLRIDQDFYIPVIHLYYNDDLTVA